jgi:dTDP-4-amino-4,6-dideoxygalactose transaminase
MELLRSHGITRNPVKMQKKPDNPCYYEQIDLGYNYRMTDIQAALGNSQMDRLDQYIKQRTEIAKWYDKQFKDTSVFPLVQKSERRSAYHLYVIKVNNRRNKLLGYLRANNIFVNLHYIPIYKHPYFYKNTSLVNAEQHYELALSLPIFPIVSEKDLSNVVQNISEFYENN